MDVNYNSSNLIFDRITVAILLKKKPFSPCLFLLVGSLLLSPLLAFSPFYYCKTKTQKAKL